MHNNTRFYILAMLTSLLITSQGIAASRKLNIKGTLQGGSGYTVVLLSKNGSVQSTTLSGPKFLFRGVSPNQLKGASLQIVDADGQYAGAVVLARRGSRVATTFSGRRPASGAAVINLGKITIADGYASTRTIDRTLVAKPNISAIDGKPIGAGELGLVSTASSDRAQSLRELADEQAPSPGADTDRDGVPDVFDVDDDGDLILDGSDPDSVGADVPYTALIADFRRSLNSHVRSGLSDELVDAIVGGENIFSLTFFVSLPPNVTADGGHIICDDSLTYCRPNTPTAWHGGISESTEEFRNVAWSSLLTSAGYPRMERVTIGTSSQAIAASIQPRVGRSQFRPGDVYRVILTNGGTEVQARTFALSPYFVSVPALKLYNAGAGDVTVDYSSVSADSGSIPGVSMGDPIVLSSSGEMTFTFWRPQRGAVRSDESGYYDWGNLRYGIVIEEAQATCAGYYSNVSSEVTADDTPLGNENSPFLNQGANPTPYTDSQPDRAANAANTLTFTVNLKECLARTGRSAGIYRVNLEARGEEVMGGTNLSAQSMYIQIP